MSTRVSNGEPKFCDDQELEHLNHQLHSSYVQVRNGLSRAQEIFVNSQMSDLTKLQGIFEDLATAVRAGREAVEQLSDHQRAVDDLQGVAA